MRTIWSRIRSLTQRRAVKRDIDEELRFHLEQRTAENIAAGMSPDAAAREARKRFGNLQNVRENCRDVRGASVGESMLQDFRFAARMLRKSPGFTVVAVLTLAFGIGANTSMFSLLNLLLFRPGPYPQADRLVRIFRTSPQSQAWPHSAGDLIDYREQNRTLERLAFYNWHGFSFAEPGRPATQLTGILASEDLFPALGVQPQLGRVFTTEENQPGNHVAVLGHNFWLRQFAADTNIIGRTVRLDGESIEVIGVMPPNFDYPLLWGGVDVWRPLALTPDQRQNRGNHYLSAFGRLKPGATQRQSQSELTGICPLLPNSGHDSIRLEPLLQSGISTYGQPMLYFTFGLGAFVLLIACANLANLQLARGTGRWREMAVRAALGADRARLMRQLLTESLLISLIGGAVGVMVGIACNAFLSRHIPFLRAHNIVIPLDFRVLGFALLCSVLTAVGFGTAPAWLSSRVDLNAALKENRRVATAGRRQQFLRHGLIIGELALALTLLTSAGLFIRNLQRYMNADPGWKVDGLMTATLAFSSSAYRSPGKIEADLAALEERLQTVPGVQSVSFSWSLPAVGYESSSYVSTEGQPGPRPGEALLTYNESVGPAFFKTLGIDLREGRTFTASDAADKPAVVIINATLARRFWPGQSPIGKHLSLTKKMEIVGVVNDVRFPGNLSLPDTPYQIYCPLSQQPGSFLRLALRTAGASEPDAAAVRSVVAAFDPDLPVLQIQTGRQVVEEALADVAVIGTVLAAFAALGLALAAVGVYGVISYAASHRTGEIGIRVALGAQRWQVLWLVLRQGLFLSLLGAAIGFVGALATAHLLGALLPGMSAGDPIILAALTTLLMIVALLASYIPARRAMNVDPMTALKYE